MAPSLEDASCLLGLAINGDPIIGLSDDEWSGLVEEAFGEATYEAFRRPPGTYHLRMVWLRRPWLPNVEHGEGREEYFPATLSPNADEDEIRHFARGYMLDLLTNVMFPENSGSVCSFFLQFVFDIDVARNWSWGSALLAHVYRGLCAISEKSTQGLLACGLFLQLWTWTRFPIGRPQAQEFNNPKFYGRPFGARWAGSNHEYPDCARGSISTYRRRFEELRDDEVNWNPYEGYFHQLPQVCQDPNESSLWFYEGPIIWMWVVEGYTPQRIMRQFGKVQSVPPPLLPCPDDLHDITHQSLVQNPDWTILHAPYVAMWNERFAHIVPHDIPYDFQSLRRYMAWFNNNGMRTVYWRGETATRIHEPQDIPIVADRAELLVPARGERVQQTVIRNLTVARDAVGAIREFTGRARAFARRVLRSCRGNLEDVNRGDIFHQFCEQHDVSQAELENSQEEQATQGDATDTEWLRNLLGSDYGRYVPDAPIFETQSQVLSQVGTWERGEGADVAEEQPESSRAAGRRRRERRPPDTYTPGDTRGRGRGRGRARR